MSRDIERKLGSTIYARINEVQMPAAERDRALNALHQAELLVDAFVAIAKKVEQLRERLFLKPALKH